MPDEIGGQNPAGNADREPTPTPPIQPNIEQRVMDLESKSHSHKKQDESSDLASAVRKGEGWPIGINVLLLITTIVIAVIYYGQLQQMTTATKATQNAVCVASNTLGETERSNRLQQESSSAALHSAIENFRLDQRAWIGIGDPVITLNATDPEKITLTLKNVGKTPATEIVSQIGIARKPKDYELKLADIKYTGEPSKSGSLFPSASTLIGKNLDTVLPGQSDEINILKSGSMIGYVFAIVTYNDVFNRPHWTHSCGVIQKDLTSIHECKIYNDTDPDVTSSAQQPSALVTMRPVSEKPCIITP
jgi:hypothetical protein